MALSNLNRTRADYIRRYENILNEIDALKEDAKGLMLEVKQKTTAGEIDFDPKMLKAAVALKRKGAKAAKAKIDAEIEFLMSAEEIEAMLE